MNKHTLTRDFYIPKPYQKLITSDMVPGLEVYLYEFHGHPCLKGFAGKRSKPDIHYSYSTTEARDEAVERYIRGQIARIEAKKEHRKTRQPSDQAKVAKLVRAWLKEQGIHGKVTSQGYSMGDSVYVTVYDQPPQVVEAIESYCSQYQYGHFNGMEDIYEYSNRRDDIPQTKFLFVRNELSRATKQKAWDIIRRQYAQDAPESVEQASDYRIGGEWGDQFLWRFMSSQDLPGSEQVWQ